MPEKPENMKQSRESSPLADVSHSRIVSGLNRLGLPVSARSILVGSIVLVCLYLTSFYSYLLFHSLAELFSVVVAGSIFIIAWNSRRFADAGYLLLLGIGYLCVGAIDLLHTLAYTGMGVFPGYGTNLPTQLWIAARYVESATLLCAPLVFGRSLPIRLLIGAYTVIFVAVVGAIFSWDIFPACFIEGEGLTPFKVWSEYAVCVILACSIVLLVRKRRALHTRVFRLLIASVGVTIVAELSFTLYADPYGYWNLLGHMLKIVSFYLIYKAIVVTALREPYNLLFRSLKQNEEELRKSENRYRLLAENLEETVKKKVAELQQAERMAALGQMISVVAHDLRNPLQNIRMGVDELRRQLGGDSEKQEVLNEIRHGVSRLDVIVSELLEYSRPLHLQYSLWTIDEIVRSAMDSVRHRYHNLGTEINLEDGNREILFDADKITRVFVNLLENAAEAMPDGGKISVSSRFMDSNGLSFLKVEVSDTGCGMDAETLARVHEPFFTTKVQGTGLGIPICRKIIEAHGGSLQVQSRVNEGTTVEIILPAGSMRSASTENQPV